MTPNDVLARVKEIVNKYLPQMSAAEIIQLGTDLAVYAVDLSEVAANANYIAYLRKGGI